MMSTEVKWIITLNCSISAKIKISNFWPYLIGHPPVRSSWPHSRRAIWFRTNKFSFGRMLKCKFISSDGSITAPVLMSIRILHYNNKSDKSIAHVTTIFWWIFQKQKISITYQSWWSASPEIRIIRPWWSGPFSAPKYGIFYFERKINAFKLQLKMKLTIFLNFWTNCTYGICNWQRWHFSRFSFLCTRWLNLKTN